MITPVVPAGKPTLLTLSKAGTTSLLVPANRIYYLNWAVLNYIASADVASRGVKLTVTLVNSIIAELTYVVATASQTKISTYGMGVISSTTPNDYNNSPAGLLPLYPGQRLGITVSSAQAADTWTLEGFYFDCPRGAE